MSPKGENALSAGTKPKGLPTSTRSYLSPRKKTTSATSILIGAQPAGSGMSVTGGHHRFNLSVPQVPTKSILGLSNEDTLALFAVNQPAIVEQAKSPIHRSPGDVMSFGQFGCGRQLVVRFQLACPDRLGDAVRDPAVLGLLVGHDLSLDDHEAQDHTYVKV